MIPSVKNYTLNVLESTEFTWVIDDFPTQKEIIISPKFSLHSYPDNRLFLGLFPSNELKILNEDILIYLWFAPKDHKRVTLRYRLSILDATGAKQCTKEFKWTFDQHDNKRCATNFIPKATLLNENNALLVEDKLTLICEVDVIKSEVETESQKVTNTIVKYDKLSEDFEGLLKSEKYTDIILITRNGKEYKAHKNILAARCSSFCQLIKSVSNEIDHNKPFAYSFPEGVFDNEEIVQEFLSFIYTGQVKSLDKYAEQLMFIAERYGIPDLMHACEQWLASTISVESVVHALLQADKNNATELKARCIDFITSHSVLVMHTEGWLKLTQEKPQLVVELFQCIAHKADPFLKGL